MAKKKANTKGKARGKKPTESSNIENEEGISTENATTEDAHTTTEVVTTEKKEGISSGSDRVLRSRGSTNAYDKGKEKEVGGVDEKVTGKKPSKVEGKGKGKKPIERANTGKEEGISTENATTEDAHTTTEAVTTEKMKGITSGSDRVLRGRGATTAYDRGKEKEVVGVDEKGKGKKPSKVAGKAKGKKPSENANNEKEEGISTENPTTEDVHTTTEAVTSEKKKGISSGCDRVLRSRGATAAYDKGKEKEVVGVDEKGTGKKPSKVAGKAKGKKPTENANTEKEEGISTKNATTEDAHTTTEAVTTEKKKGISGGSDRVLRNRGETTTYDKGKEKEVVGVDEKGTGKKPTKVVETAKGKKPMTDGIKLVVDLPITRDSCATVKEKLVLGGSGRSLRPQAVKQVEEIGVGKKGVDGSEATKKAKGKNIVADLPTKRDRGDAFKEKLVLGGSAAGMPSTKVREDHDDVKAATSIETDDEKTGIDGSKAVQKVKGKKSAAGMPAPQVESEASVSVRRNPARTARKDQEIKK